MSEELSDEEIIKNMLETVNADISALEDGLKINRSTLMSNLEYVRDGLEELNENKHC